MSSPWSTLSGPKGGAALIVEYQRSAGSLPSLRSSSPFHFGKSMRAFFKKKVPKIFHSWFWISPLPLVCIFQNKVSRPCVSVRPSATKAKNVFEGSTRDEFCIIKLPIRKIASFLFWCGCYMSACERIFRHFQMDKLYEHVGLIGSGAYGYGWQSIPAKRCEHFFGLTIVYLTI